MQLRWMLCVGCITAWGLTAFGQGSASNQKETACTFEDGGQLSVRYQPATAHGDHPPDGKAWSPGQAPALLFTSTPLNAGDTKVPVGAYSLYIIANKSGWTMVVNKGVTDAKYDEEKNAARLPMEIGMVEQPEKNVILALGHVAPKQCNLRVYYGKTGAWATFREQ